MLAYFNPSNQQERKTSRAINACKKLPQLPREPQPRTQGLGLCSWRKRTYGTPDGSSEWRRRGVGSLKPALPRLCAYTKSTTERMRGERVGTSKEGVGRTGKEESGGKGASRRRRNKSGSQEKEQGRGGGLSRSATPIQDHRQLYFKGNSQNCSTGLYNRRMSILLLDMVPKVIKGIAASHLRGRRLNKEGFQQQRCWKCHASDTSEHISIKTRRH